MHAQFLNYAYNANIYVANAKICLKPYLNQAWKCKLAKKGIFCRMTKLPRCHGTCTKKYKKVNKDNKDNKM